MLKPRNTYQIPELVRRMKAEIAEASQAEGV